MFLDFMDTIFMNYAKLVAVFLLTSTSLIQGMIQMDLFWKLMNFFFERVHGRRIPFTGKPISFKAGFCEHYILLFIFFRKVLQLTLNSLFFKFSLLLIYSFFLVGQWISFSLPHEELASNLRLNPIRICSATWAFTVP